MVAAAAVGAATVAAGVAAAGVAAAAVDAGLLRDCGGAAIRASLRDCGPLWIVSNFKLFSIFFKVTFLRVLFQVGHEQSTFCLL